MKYLLIFLLLFTFGNAQVKTLINGTISETAANTTTTASINPTKEFKTTGDFFGFMVLTLDVDDIYAAVGDVDAFYTRPEYRIGGIWYEGGVMVWDRFPTDSIDATLIDTNIKNIYPATFTDSLLTWQLNPANTNALEGLPVFTDFRLKIYNTSADTHFDIDIRMGRH